MMKRISLLCFLLLLLFTHLQANTFTVNNTADTQDASPGNGVCADAGGNCTFRAAIMEANALAGNDTINLPAGTYTLTLAGVNENGCLTGDLDVTSNIVVFGAGARTTAVNADSLDRILHVQSAGVLEISGV